MKRQKIKITNRHSIMKLTQTQFTKKYGSSFLMKYVPKYVDKVYVAPNGVYIWEKRKC